MAEAPALTKSSRAARAALGSLLAGALLAASSASISAAPPSAPAAQPAVRMPPASCAFPRGDRRRELPVDLAAVAGHHALGLAFAAARPLTGAELHRHENTHDAMPVADGALTTREVRDQAGAVLPGVRVRRLLFFRYLLTWQKPA